MIVRKQSKDFEKTVAASLSGKGGGLLELRVRGKQEVRIFYAFASGKRIYLLHAFIKKARTTPKKELDLARQRQAQLEKRNA